MKRLSRNEIEEALEDDMGFPKALTPDELRKLNEAAKAKGRAITSDEELHEILRPGEKFVKIVSSIPVV